MNFLPQRKQHRLDLALYGVVGSLWSITIAVKHRERVFNDHALARGAASAIDEVATTQEIPILASCIMPDHVHVVLSPSSRCDVPTFVNRVKHITWMQVRAGRTTSYWQRSFWDTGIRHESQLARTVMYVMKNPQRAGLIQEWLEWPYSYAPWLNEARRRRSARDARAGASPAPTDRASVVR